MTPEVVFILLVFLTVIILFIISKLNRAIKLVNNRINIQSRLIKKLQSDTKEDDADKILRQIIEKDFG